MVLHIRTAEAGDLPRCAAIESTCFPPEQAASPEAIRERLASYPDHMLLGELEGEVIGYIMGPVIDTPLIEDAMFADANCHRPDGDYQAVFSLAVLPTAQRQGIGSQLIHAMLDLARREGRRGVTLTCREAKIPYYASFGFRDLGLSRSVHGGVPWHDMTLDL